MEERESLKGKKSRNDIVMFSESHQKETKRRIHQKNEVDDRTEINYPVLHGTPLNVKFFARTSTPLTPRIIGPKIASPFNNSAILRMQTRELSSHRITNLTYGI